jgi:AcrR family transcriptional regulator
LQAAENLFSDKGFTQTSIAAIITEVGVAKGTFYHYFKSKKHVLTALVERLGERLRSHFQTLADDSSVDAKETLRLMITGADKKRLSDSPLLHVVEQAANRELQERLNCYVIETVAPLLTQVFERGYQEGVFSCQVSLETTQLILASSLFVLDSGLFSWSNEKRNKLNQSLQQLLEQSLGVVKGSLGFTMGDV